MPIDRGAAELVRSLGLVVDGPVRWGTGVPSRAPGILVVESESSLERAPIDLVAVRRWIERVPSLRLDGEPTTPNALADRLGSFWQPERRVLYVGRTLKSLGARVGALYGTPLGDRRPHAGGHWLKTLDGLPRLLVWWAETDSPEEHEDALLDAFAATLDGERQDGRELPWAVLESPSGVRKVTGISGSLLSDEEVAARAAAAPPSTSSATRRPVRKPAGAPARPRSPRAKKIAAPPPGGPQETHLTSEGLAALQEELGLLTEVERPAVIERVKHARELGDLRENADYEAARNEQSFLEGRVRDLEARIRTAVIIEAGPADVVRIGSSVTLEQDGEQLTLTIVGSTEADPANGRISQASPVGRALLGARPGDDVVVHTPSHESHYRVIAVS